MQTLHRSTLIALTALAAPLLLFAQSRTSVSSAGTQARSTTVRDGLVITQNVTPAPGTYKISDADADGVIQIRADDITLDGTGVTLVGDGRGYGISMNGHKGLTLRNFNVSGYLYGVHISNASNVLIQNSNISGNHKDITTGFLDIGLDEKYGGGIFFRNVSSSTVQDNTLTNQSTGLEMVASNNNRVLNNVTSSGPALNEAG
jgi:parallel beta-helix repeat protein